MPIYATSTYVQQSPGVHKGYEYARTPEPDAHGVRALHRRSRRRHARLRLRLRPRGDLDRARMPRPRLACRRRPTISMAARGGCSSACASARPGLDVTYVDLSDPAALEAAIRPNTQADLGRDADQSAAQAGRPRTRRRDRARSAASGPPPTTPSPAPMSSGRSSTASTSWCIRRPNISTAIPTWSAASRSSARTRSCASGSAFLQNAVGAHPGAVRFLPGAARPQDAGAAHGAALRLGAEDRAVARSAPQGARACSIPGCRAIRSTRWPSSRCAPSAA